MVVLSEQPFSWVSLASLPFAETLSSTWSSSLHTMNYPYLSPSRRFILHFENLLPLLSITSTLVAPQVLKETYSRHQLWLRHRFEGEVQIKIYLVQPCSPGKLCVFFDLNQNCRWVIRNWISLYAAALSKKSECSAWGDYLNILIRVL